MITTMIMRAICHALSIATALALVSCREPAKSDDDPIAHLPIMRQVELVEDDLLERAQKNARKSCPRPVLRGAPMSGKAADQMIAVIEGDDWDLGCRALLDDKNDQLSAALFHKDADEPSGYPRRRLDTSRPLESPDADLPVLDAVLEICGPSVVMLQRATKHKNSCSPYLPGVRCVPSYTSLLRLSLAAVAGARAHMRRGQQREAFEILADTIRFAQDFHRGGASLLEAMIGSVVIARASSAIELQLRQPERLGPELLGQIDRELADLIASEPHPSSFLVGDQLSMVFYMILPEARGPSWTPPGGWLEECDRPTGYGMDQSASLALVVAHRNILRMERACPADATPHRCAQRLEQLAVQLAAETEQDGLVNKLVRTITAEDRQDEILRQVVQVLDSIAAPSFARYVRRHGHDRVHLAGLRLFARYRSLAEQRGSCPGIEVFDSPAFTEVRGETYSRGELRIEQLEQGSFAVRLPQNAEVTLDEDDIPVIVIACQLGADS
jgi:hypothetical protein